MDESTTVGEQEVAVAVEEGTQPTPDQGGVEPGAIAPAVEAVLLTSERPVSAARLLEALGLAQASETGGKPPVRSRRRAPAAAEPAGDAAEGSGGDVAEADSRAARKGARDAKAAITQAIDLLNAEYERSGRSFRVEQVAGGYRLMTLPQFAGVVAAFQGAKSKSTLSHASLETLAIIAYKQPVTRAQLEAIRGVSCGEVLRSLIDRRLVTITGRAEELGRPLLYGTTKQFLEVFGLSSIKDLPSPEELRARYAAATEE